MLTKLHLERFKNFKDANLHLGPLTVICGTNASGKSNLRDAFKFLHGISRGYSLADILGEKWIEGGVLQWRGIRGGTREATYLSAPTFALEISLPVQDGKQTREASYAIEVEVGANGKAPRVVRESLIIQGRGQYVFDSHPESNPPEQADPLHLSVRIRKEPQKGYVGPVVKFISARPVISQILDHPDIKTSTVKELTRLVLSILGNMRFLDLSPEAMRNPSIPGQTILGDRGENLSSVLQAICEDPNRKISLVQWIQELTPMDVQDFRFEPDSSGRILVSLLEQEGRATSAYSASDGTLRFLAMIAALLGPAPARFYFFEELENGIHPTRLHLLLQLIEQRVSEGTIQMVATTHSPQLLNLLSKKALESSSITYRLEGNSEAKIIRIVDIPEARRVLESQDLSRLLSSGWLEDAMEFTAVEGE